MKKPLPTDLRYLISDSGEVWSTISNRYLKTCITKGYRLVFLGRKTRKVHRLVALTYLKNPLAKQEVNHKDGNKLNNHVSNLEWVTNKENIAHSCFHQLHAFGERNGGAKLNRKQVLEIRKSYVPRICTSGHLARKYGVSPSQILDIVKRKLWKHI